MSPRQIVRSALLVAMATAALGCQDRPAPTESASPNLSVITALADRALADTQNSGSSPSVVSVLTRTAPLASDVSASRTIGPEGGVIYLPGAGLTFVVPKGALAAPVTITATAPAGSYVLFSFQPHGLVFRVPAYAAVNLRGTSARYDSSQPAFRAGYIADANAVDAQGNAESYEQESVVVDVLGSMVVFNVPHFSTLALASGSVSH